MGREDEGSSLVEAIVGISLLGLTVVGVLDATWTNARAAAEAHIRSLDSAVLAETRFRLEQTAFSTCPHIDLSYEQALSRPHTRGRNAFSVNVTRYEYWKEESTAWVDFGGLTQLECSSLDDLAGDFAVQRITVSMASVSNSLTTTSLVKSRDTAL